jgi:hypothetical protein
MWEFFYLAKCDIWDATFEQRLYLERLGVGSIVTEACQNDRLGAMVLERMILNQGMCMSLGGIGFAEILLTGAWYIWWERRQFMHGENLQLTHKKKKVERKKRVLDAAARRYSKDQC